MNAKKITKKAFLAAAKKGWEDWGYCSGVYYEDDEGSPVDRDEAGACRACAIGSAAAVLGVEPDDLWSSIGTVLASRVAARSDDAGSKKAALAAISKLKWGA